MNSIASILRDELEKRSVRNPNYSMSAFARDAGIVKSRISELLRGKQGLSRNAALRIGKNLHLPDEIVAEFSDLATLSHSRSPTQRKLARQRQELREQQRKAPFLSPDQFVSADSWEQFAILCLTRVTGFRPDARWIADRLGADETRITIALENLQATGLLKEENGVVVAYPLNLSDRRAKSRESS